MNVEIPYRAAGTFTGEAYVERKADRALAREIRGNQRFPYVVAPRQSGKSSLLVRTLEALPPKECRGALVDLSPLPLDDYEKFWRLFLVEIARSAKLPQDCIDPAEPEDTFRAWLALIPERLVIFVDEIDALIGASFRDLFFSKVRSLFNQRARDKELRRLQFVLAGAAHPARLIQDQMRSPFNVGVEIALDELSLEQVERLVLHLAGVAAEIAPGVGKTIHEATSGLPFLCQLTLERLWLLAEEKKSIDAGDVKTVLEEIVENAPRDIHFSNIYEIVANDPRLLQDLGRLLEGKPILLDRARELRLSGLTDGRGPFLNELYRRVFGKAGPLDLESLVPVMPMKEAIAEEKKVDLSLERKEAPRKPMPVPVPAPAPPVAEMDDSPVAEAEQEQAPITLAGPKLELEAVPESIVKPAATAAKTIVLEPPHQQTTKQAARFGPVLGALSFAAAAVLMLFVAERRGFFVPKERMTPTDLGLTAGPASATPMASRSGGAGFFGDDPTIGQGVGSAERVFPVATALPDEMALRCGAAMAVVSTDIDYICIDKAEVTVAAYQQCVRDGKCAACDGGPDEACVTFAQATAYCEMLGKRLATDSEFDLVAAQGFSAPRYPLVPKLGFRCAKAVP